MSNENSTRYEREQQLDAIVAAYYRAVDAGECVDQKDFIAQHPEVQKLLSEFFQDVRVFERNVRRDSLNHAMEATIVSQSAQSLT